MMHVLHVITAFDRGGAENHLADLIRHQRSTGCAVSVAYLRGKGGWAPAVRALGIEVHDLGLRFYGDPRPLWRLRGLVAGGHFDLVHAHLPPAELYVRCALLGASAKRLPLIISKHNDCPFHRLPGERLVGRWVARRAALVIAISQAVHRYITGPALGLPAGKVQTILYGIDAVPFTHVDAHAVAELRRTWDADAETLVIGFAGRLVEQKAIDTLIRAFALFQQRSGCSAKLVIAGRGPLEPTLRACADACGVADHVAWAGFHDNVPVLMQAFDIFALTSVHEGFGLVLAEAMVAGRAVVATRAGAIPEVVADGESGLLCDHDPAQIADALRKLSEPALRARFGAAGAQRVRENFTLERMCEATDAAYARCLRRAHHPAPANAAAAASLG